MLLVRFLVLCRGKNTQRLGSRSHRHRGSLEGFPIILVVSRVSIERYRRVVDDDIDERTHDTRVCVIASSARTCSAAMVAAVKEGWRVHARALEPRPPRRGTHTMTNHERSISYSTRMSFDHAWFCAWVSRAINLTRMDVLDVDYDVRSRVRARAHRVDVTPSTRFIQDDDDDDDDPDRGSCQRTCTCVCARVSCFV